jgi:hypothetical protein
VFTKPVQDLHHLGARTRTEAAEDMRDARRAPRPHGKCLSAAREDFRGATLRRITNGMTGLTTKRLADGSTVYSGAVPARLAAPETGFKDGQALRVLPFGYVANGEAGNPAALLDATVTVGADGVVQEILLTWGTWTYAATYSKLGSTAAPRAPRTPFHSRSGGG